MKLTKSQLKEIIRQSIDELKEGGEGSGPSKGDRKGMDYKDGKPDSIPASEWEKMDADEREYHTSGQYDKDAEGDDTGKDDKPYTDDDEDHGSWSEGKITKSKLKEMIREEMKSLNETVPMGKHDKIKFRKFMDLALKHAGTDPDEIAKSLFRLGIPNKSIKKIGDVFAAQVKGME